MRTWLESQPTWISALVWISASIVALVIVLAIIFAIWFGIFFESR